MGPKRNKNVPSDSGISDEERFSAAEMLTYMERKNSVLIDYSDGMKGGGKKPTTEEIVKFMRNDLHLKDEDVVDTLFHTVVDRIVIGCASEKVAEELHGRLDSDGGVRWGALGKWVKGFRTDLPMVEVVVKNVSPAVNAEMIRKEIESHFCKEVGDKVEKLDKGRLADFNMHALYIHAKLRMQAQTVIVIRRLTGDRFINRDKQC